MTTWRRQLDGEMEFRFDWGPVLAYAPNEAAFDVEFEDEGNRAGPPVLAWTYPRVYFPVASGGLNFMCSVPRQPQDEAEQHIG